MRRIRSIPAALRPTIARFAVLGLFSLVAVSMAVPALARPSAMRIFPKETLAFVRLAHAREVYEMSVESSVGRMLQDPEIRPFFEHLYGSIQTAYEENVQEEIGLSLDEILQIPQGEIAAGLIARERGKPTFAFSIDLGDETTAAHKLLDRLLEVMVENGGAREIETIGELEVTVVRIEDEEIEAVAFIEREDTLIIVADLDLARQMLALWDAAEGNADAGDDEAEGDADEAADEPADEPDTAEDDGDKKTGKEPYWAKSLAENPQFVSVMRHCRTEGDAPPHLIAFADPIEIFRNFARGEAGMAIAVATLKPLGLDGIRAVGYSVTMGDATYEDITHMHLLLDNPRAGVLSLFNLRTGDLTPEPWVPEDMETYISGYWDVPLTYDKSIALYDQFQYQGALEKIIERNFNEPTALNLREEIINQAAGRFSMLVGFQKPAMLRPRALVVAMQVKDESAALATIEKLVALEPDEFEERTFGGVKYWVISDALQQGGDEESPEEELPVSPCFGVVDGYAMFSLATQTFQWVVGARDGTRGRLAESDDYVEMASHLSRQSAEPGGVLVTRPEKTFGYLYGLATSDRIREQLSEIAEDTEVFAALDRALTEAPLPPFEVFAKYLAPAGGIVTDSETGYHFVSFTLKRD